MKRITVALAILSFMLTMSSATVAQSQSPVILAAGDIAGCGQTNDTLTSDILLQYPAAYVLTLGDLVYPDGTPQQYADCYDPTWGRAKDRTFPSPGNHDFHQNSDNGYASYFTAAGRPIGNIGEYWYSYNLGAWHIISLNSECSSTGYGLPTTGCNASSPQYQWLQADLAANPAPCILAYWHKPRFVSGSAHASSTKYSPFWQLLYAAGADIVLSGHEHNYERLARANDNGDADPNGIRSFIVGTGGSDVYAGAQTPLPISEARQGNQFGVLKLTLHPSSFDWEFLAAAGQGTPFTDTGSENCTGAPTLAVDAGPDQTVPSLGSADLSGSVANAAGAYTAVWSTVTQSCTPRFEAPTALVTRFSATCTYTLRLTATDTVGSVSDDVVINVTGDAYAPPPTPTPAPTPTATPTPAPGGTITIPIVAANDDAEERTSSTGNMYLDSTDLEMTQDGNVNQTVGLRFLGVSIPQGSTITSATVQFVVDEVSTGPASMTIHAQASGNAPPFVDERWGLSSRPRTTASVAWSPAPWPVRYESGPDQRTPNIAAMIQEVVDRSDWQSGNAIAILIPMATGVRTARSYEKAINQTAALTVTWQ